MFLCGLKKQVGLDAIQSVSVGSVGSIEGKAPPLWYSCAWPREHQWGHIRWQVAMGCSGLVKVLSGLAGANTAELRYFGPATAGNRYHNRRYFVRCSARTASNVKSVAAVLPMKA